MNKVVLGTIAANALLGIAKATIGSRSYMETGIIEVTVKDRYANGFIYDPENGVEKPFTLTEENIRDCIERITDIKQYIEENGRDWFVEEEQLVDSYAFFAMGGFPDFEYEGYDVSYSDIEIMVPMHLIKFDQKEINSEESEFTATFSIPLTSQTIACEFKQIKSDIQILFKTVFAHMNTYRKYVNNIVEPIELEYGEFRDIQIVSSNPLAEEFPLKENLVTNIRRF